MNLARRIWLIPASIAALLITIGVTSAGTLDTIGQEKSIRIAYREDAPPFSYKDKIGEPANIPPEWLRTQRVSISSSCRCWCTSRGTISKLTVCRRTD
jgi:ABC-type amino acid transport substrate-binding protein